MDFRRALSRAHTHIYINEDVVERVSPKALHLGQKGTTALLLPTEP